MARSTSTARDISSPPTSSTISCARATISRLRRGETKPAVRLEAHSFNTNRRVDRSPKSCAYASPAMPRAVRQATRFIEVVGVKMVASDSFADVLREQLAPLGHVTLRRMFGKTGVFCDRLMLAMVRDDVLYFPVDV